MKSNHKFYLIFLICLLQSSILVAADNLLLQQLNQIGQFELSHNAAEDKGGKVRDFVKTQQKGHGQTEAFSPESLAAFEKFFLFVFTDEDREVSAKALKALQIAGQFDYKQLELATSTVGPFAGHVKEAIKINKERSAYYASRTGNKSLKLSKLYTGLEYSILPIARIFDRWAAWLMKKGIPVMANDFVMMNDLPTPDTWPVRMGRLSPEGIKQYHAILKDFRKKSFKATGNKDFVSLQVFSIAALHQLKALQEIHRCNLSLSIHLIESIGLAARNADILTAKHGNCAAQFYRAFILMQVVGTRLFAGIDPRAQFFHQEGVGIICNDLPIIPFP